jgi:protein involved in polysaccharide export with SLBB domain
MTHCCEPRHRVFRAAVFSFPALLVALTGLILLVCPPTGAVAQEVSPAMIDEAVRRTGLSREELQRRYGNQVQQAGAMTGEEQSTPGRTSLGTIDDSVIETATVQPWRDTSARAILPFSGDLDAALIEERLEQVVAGDSVGYFGADFFRLDSGTFTPPSFGPVSGDYRLGIGDEVVINAWGGVEFQIIRLVDRDGAILLPRSGKVACAGRTLAEVSGSVRSRLAESHASIAGDESGDGSAAGATTVEITLGHLRPIKVFVVGAATRPGSYELSSASRILTALAAAGGPNVSGSLRRIQLVRGEETVTEFDLYDYLLGGSRAGDARLQEGDTVFIPDIGPSVRVRGEVRRAMYYELLPGETLTDLIGFAGGFTASAAPDVIHMQRILPPAQRRDGEPDSIYLDVVYNAANMAAEDGYPVPLLDGDVVEIGATKERLENWVEVKGPVKRPGRYELDGALSVLQLIDMAGGLWPEALTERAVVDRTGADWELSSFAFSLADELSGTASPVLLQPRDVVHLFSRREVQERPQVHISGEVYSALQEDFRQGMTLRDLILKAGGLKQSADRVRVEVARLRQNAMQSRDTGNRPAQTVDILELSLEKDFLTSEKSMPLEPWDRVSVRRLPWWELQSTVKVRGEVFYPGQFSLERKDETLSSLIERAGGLKPDAYLIGARLVRAQHEVGNVAIDLTKALDEPGGPFDLILQDGDEILIPDQMFTVKVVGEVGFPTSLVFEDGKNINYFVDRAGGFLDKADKKKTRVVYPNGLSLPNKRGAKVVAGSTIIVPLKAPQEGDGKLGTLREISGIFASLATVWLVIDNTTR